RAVDAHRAAAVPALGGPASVEELVGLLGLVAPEHRELVEHARAALRLRKHLVFTCLVAPDEAEDDARAAIGGRVVEGRGDHAAVGKAGAVEALVAPERLRVPRGDLREGALP